MAATWQKAEQRWNRLIAIIEEMGFVRTSSWEEALRLSRSGVRAYYTRDGWLGVGSAYIKLREGYDTVEVRISDHAQRPGGGMRYSPLLDDYDRAGESDVSIHPGSGVTLRNVRRHIEAAFERARLEDEEE